MHLVVGNTSSAEDGGSKDGHTRDTNPLLHDLEPDNELNTTTSVKFARADTEKHRDVGLTLGRLTLEFSDISNILEFGLGFANILASLATKAAKNVTGLFFTANLDEPTGRLGEEPTNCKENK